MARKKQTRAADQIAGDTRFGQQPLQIKACHLFYFDHFIPPGNHSRPDFYQMGGEYTAPREKVNAQRMQSSLS
jgi:hypothetical protein